MIMKISLSLVATFSVYAEFNLDSLVLTEGPSPYELVTYQADSKLRMAKDLDEAINLAVQENKPIILIVVGQANCPWSEKLLMDVIYKPEFYEKAQKDYILCKVQLDHLNRKGEELGLDHPVEKVPYVLLMSKEGHILATREQLPEAPDAFLAYFTEAIQSSGKVDEVLKSGLQASEKTLEESYKIAKRLGLTSESELFSIGLSKKKNLYFLLEKYQKLLVKGTHKEVKDLKLDIQRLDPRNSKGAIRMMALLEFEERSRQKKGMDNPFSALKPLFEYLRDYGHYDKEFRWEIEMRIAQFLYSKNQLQAALQHASRSLEWAPEDHKSEVGEAVDYLKSQKKKEEHAK